MIIAKARTAALLAIVLFVCLFFYACPNKNNDTTSSIRSNTLTSGIPCIPDSFRSSLACYQNTRGVELEDFEPGGSGVIILKRASQTNQIFVAPSPGKSARQLTSFSGSALNATVCPDHFRKCLLFEQDSLGNENFQLFSLTLDSLNVRQITHNAFQNEGVVWSNSGDRFSFESTRRNGIDYDIYISNIAAPSDARCVLSKGGSWTVCDWSPTDSLLLVSQYLSRTSSYLHILNIVTGAVHPLHDSIGSASEEIGNFGPQGKGVFFTSDKGTDFRVLRYLDFSLKKELFLTQNIHADIGELALSKDRTLLAFSANENGFTRIYLMNTRSFAFKPLPNMPQGIINRIRFNSLGTMIAMSIKTPQQPESVIAIDLKNFTVLNWVDGEFGTLKKRDMVMPEIISYPTFDSSEGKPRMIPCFYYKPNTSKPPFPTLIMIHGGPESQFWPAFSASIQFYVQELGIAVLAPNVRGSSGYGKAYLELDNGVKREDAVRDIGALLDWIAKQPALDASHAAVFGGSYGGYMSLASMIHYNDRLKAGIDIYGISNFLTYLEHTAPYRRDLRRVEYGDERSATMRNFLIKISPMTNAFRITKPLCIVQGANDPRVPAEESRQIANAINKNKGVVWLSIVADEGHGFRIKSNVDQQELIEAYFLKTFLIAN